MPITQNYSQQTYFGYKKGAFTGADSDNLGLLHFADGGVLFLDEVHCLNAECQEKLFLYMDQGILSLSR